MTVPREPRTPEEALAAALRPIVNDWFDTGYEAGKLDPAVLANRIAHLVSGDRPDTGERRLREALRERFDEAVYQQDDGTWVAKHGLATIDELAEIAQAALGADSESPGFGEAADWQAAAIETGGTGAIRPGGGVGALMVEVPAEWWDRVFSAVARASTDDVPECSDGTHHVLQLARNVLAVRPRDGVCSHCEQLAPCTERRIAEAFVDVMDAALAGLQGEDG